ncbi:probable alpha-mannosidase At5g66150 [Humulus lupulus]|uniref:probable alpha-mannosidase At5g66150 n=1 Tax=Humulus lupulus TaxID=3486 RepID=UPI002B407A9C|nr:probable alpha-mannosidase At5g66150 [Humulus lupulus]
MFLALSYIWILIRPHPAIWRLSHVNRNLLSKIKNPQNDTIEVGPRDLKLTFLSTSGQLKQMYNSKTEIESKDCTEYFVSWKGAIYRYCKSCFCCLCFNC